MGYVTNAFVFRRLHFRPKGSDLNDENGPYNINRGKDKKITMSLKNYVEQMRAQKARKVTARAPSRSARA